MFVLEFSLFRIDFLPWRYQIAREEKWQQEVCFACDTSKIDNKTCWDTFVVAGPNDTDNISAGGCSCSKNSGCGQNKRCHWSLQEKETWHFFFPTWTLIWFSYKAFSHMWSAPSRATGIKYSVLLALLYFTREVQHLRGRQLGNMALARKEVMEILSLGIQKPCRHGVASGLSPVRGCWEEDWIGE